MDAASLIVSARYRVRPESRVAFLEAAHRLVKQTEEDGGCLEFRVLFDAHDPEFFVLYQTWTGVEPMTRHFQTEPMTQFQETVKKLRVPDPETRRYRVAA